MNELKAKHQYPVYFFKSDTTGEKDFDEAKLEHFTKTIAAFKQKGEWNRAELIDLFNYMIPNFNHKETGKFLDGRM